MKGATTIARDTAQILFTDGSVQQIEPLFALADELRSDMRMNFLACTLPGIVAVSGVYLLNFGIFTTSLFAWGGLSAGITNAMRPLWRHRGGGSAAVRCLVSRSVLVAVDLGGRGLGR